jgi:hypothetical protein
MLSESTASSPRGLLLLSVLYTPATSGGGGSLETSKERGMVHRQSRSWHKGELYESLCLLMIAACVWLSGHYLGLFRQVGAVVQEHGLSEVVMFGFCMSFGILAASVHKSLKLRREMRARVEAEEEAGRGGRRPFWG